MNCRDNCDMYRPCIDGLVIPPLPVEEILAINCLYCCTAMSQPPDDWFSKGEQELLELAGSAVEMAHRGPRKKDYIAAAILWLARAREQIRRREIRERQAESTAEQPGSCHAESHQRADD